MSVYKVCLSCVHPRNRRWALLPEQIPVASGRVSSWRILDELADGTSQFAGLVFGDEGVAVGDLDQAPMWEQLSKHALPTLAPLHELAHHEDHACGSQEKPGVNRTAEGNAGAEPRPREALQEEVAEAEQSRRCSGKRRRSLEGPGP